MPLCLQKFSQLIQPNIALLTSWIMELKLKNIKDSVRVKMLMTESLLNLRLLSTHGRIKMEQTLILSWVRTVQLPLDYFAELLGL